jgi:hypothetical protein
MKTVVIYIGIILITAFLFSCKDNDTTKQEQKGSVSSTAIDLDERFKTADSLVVVFYKDPYGEDSLRYTRYYTQAFVTDTKAISVLQKELAQTFGKQEKRNSCRGEGKIWCFTKGKIFQTLYFSTRCDDCCYLYLIKDGNFYYSRISSSMISWLAGLKPLSAEPENAGEAGND